MNITATRTENANGTFTYTFDGTDIYANSKKRYVAVSAYRWSDGTLMPAFHTSATAAAKASSKYGVPRIALIDLGA